MIRTRYEACLALGLSDGATITQIKAAYKDLVKRCHPDATGNHDATIYNRITEAYQFLMTEHKGKALTHTKVVGGAKSSTKYGRTASNADYVAFQKKVQKAKNKKAEEFEQKQKDFSAKIKKQEADYKRAMEAIDAIRVARAIESMVWANGLGKENLNDKDKDW
ncbi:DnaJ domain-containing protein [Pseudobutyrivibrio sp. AR14]|uniref:J domain-containing protein n=1 Tax=Pseudobutyrivibrio sp. AR14 TaxID=1520804 RepID=UPI000887B02D|nr:DnaJ domain-containing protein [Pseudobutyrivibrio sp. AR14]SCX92942.1 DnaJ domain-containing protein [Pseudobutyrivibrio sp. AR14]